jgi:hypothetical protein
MDVMNQQDTGTNDTGTANDTGSDSSMMGVDASALNCAYYCATITSLCGATATDQYKDNATCMSMCANIPNEAGAGATSGDSLACRMTALAGLTSSNAAVNCSWAGPYGFGSTTNVATGCGSLCTDFCEQYYKSICGANSGYPSADVCRTYCEGAAGEDASTGDPGTASGSPAMACREYHLENAIQNGGNGGGHCAHAGEDGGGVCP